MEQLVNFIIRPPRAEYSPRSDLLDEEFMLKGRWYQRKDLEVINSRGNKLKCSHYLPLVIPEGKTLPCVIYCHGNSGCRADASEAALILLPSNITVFTLDFSGSGLSEGEHVTLGWNEKDDLRAVVNHLRTDGNVSCIGLWGRSMGAVTSLMYGAEDPSIAGMVLDSPFSNLVDLMMELVDTYKYPLPKFTVKLAIQHMRKVIRKKANFDITEMDTIQGDKNIIKFDGDHNSPRPQFYFDSITIFFHNVLSPPKDVSDEQYYHTVHDFFDKDNWGTVHEVENGHHNFTGIRPELATGSTEDAITQLRSRRPMSRTEVPSDVPPKEKQDGPEENGTDGPSSSRAFSVAHPDGHSPSEGDDEFLEYTFDNLSDIPSSMEDEERMIMEAIIESLKDLDSRHPQEDEQPTVGNSAPPDPVLNSVLSSMPSLNELSQETSSTNSKPKSSTGTIPNTSTGTITNTTGSHTATDSSSIKGSNSSSSTSNSAWSSSCESSSGQQDSDTADGTRATLVVQKNPSSHVIDGLAHRWGLNFFKSNR